MSTLFQFPTIATFAERVETLLWATSEMEDDHIFNDDDEEGEI